jgi:ParB-like chromosome segregation protein Spo0J
MDAEPIRLNTDDEFEKLIPPLTDEEYQLLHENIAANGCLNPIIVWDNTVLDGHNRYHICHLLKMPFSIREMHFASREDAKIWIVQHQIGKRNLNPAQKIELALKMKPLIAEKAKANQRAAGGTVPTKVSEPMDTRDIIAETAGVSPAQVSKWEKIVDLGTEEEIKKVRQGTISINAMYQKLQGPIDAPLFELQEKRMHTLLREINSRVEKLIEMPKELLNTVRGSLEPIILRLGTITSQDPENRAT